VFLHTFLGQVAGHSICFEIPLFNAFLDRWLWVSHEKMKLQKMFDGTKFLRDREREWKIIKMFIFTILLQNCLILYTSHRCSSMWSNIDFYSGKKIEKLQLRHKF